MKIAFTLLIICLCSIGKLIYLYQSAFATSLTSASNNIIEVNASLDNHLMYLVITAGVLSIFKLKKNPG
jgi:uncharacterized protein (UPF0333 family)